MSRIVHTKLPGVRVTVESSGASVANAMLVASILLGMGVPTAATTS